MYIKKTLFSILAIFLIFSLAWTTGQTSRASASAALQASGRAYLPIVLYIPPPSPSFTFISWADTQSGLDDLATLSNQAKTLGPAFTIFAGDLEMYGFTTSGMNTWKKAMNGNTSNGMFDITLAVRGNHDESNITGWQNYFNFAGTVARVGGARFSALDKNLTYSFDYGNARFIGIDVTGNSQEITSAQVNYLDSVLTGAENLGLAHAFIYFHGPIYPISKHNTCNARTCATTPSVVSLAGVLNKHDIVSAIFNGHEHIQGYVHMDKTRVPEITNPFEQFITSTAGANEYSCNQSYRFDYCGVYHGFTLVKVEGKTFTVNVYRINTATPVKTWTFTKP